MKIQTDMACRKNVIKHVKNVLDKGGNISNLIAHVL